MPFRFFCYNTDVRKTSKTNVVTHFLMLSFVTLVLIFYGRSKLTHRPGFPDVTGCSHTSKSYGIPLPFYNISYISCPGDVTPAKSIKTSYLLLFMDAVFYLAVVYYLSVVTRFLRKKK